MLPEVRRECLLELNIDLLSLLPAPSFLCVLEESVTSALLRLIPPKRDDVREPKEGVGIRDMRCGFVEASDDATASDVRRRPKALLVNLFNFPENDDLRRILSDRDGLGGGISWLRSIECIEP